MRRTLISAAATAALVVSSLATATAVTRVDANHFAGTGLTRVSRGCVDSRAIPVTEPKFVIKRGAGSPIGQHASGWVPDGSTYGVGVTTRISRPTTLKSLRIHVNAPGGEALGHVIATYHASGDTGVWQGNANLGTDKTKGWHRVDATGALFSWQHFTDGVPDRSDSDFTLQEFADRQGGDGDGADLGFIYGCDGNGFLVDDFEVVTKNQKKVFDLGGYRTTTSLVTGGKARGNLTITCGEKVDATAKLRLKYGNKAIPGKLRLQSRRLSGSTWSTFDKRKVGSTGNTSFTVRPSISSAYRATYAGTATREGNLSQVLRIHVRKKVTSRLVDATVTQGHLFTSAGRILPAKATGFTLQRYLDGRWQTLKKGRSGSDGRFRIAMKTTRVGTSYWRIRAGGGGGTLAGDSKAMKLTTKAPPSGGGGGDEPPPPTDDPPPPPDEPPPPTHRTR